MWEVDRVLETSASYEQVGPHQWRASLGGIVTASALAATPFHCQLQLKRAVDFVLSRVVRGVGPFTYEGDGATAGLAPRWEKILTAEAAKVAVSAMPKKPARSTKPKLAGIPR